MRAELNTKLDDLLDRLVSLRADIDDTRGHVLYGLSENPTLSQRITRLENEGGSRERRRALASSPAVWVCLDGPWTVSTH